MAKIKTLQITRRDPKTKQMLINTSIDIKVNSQGKFYGTIPQDIYSQLEKMNLVPDTIKNINYSMPKTPKGTCFANSLVELETILREAVAPLAEYETISDIIVIKYIIESACCYCISKDGQFYPHGKIDKDIEFEMDQNNNFIFQQGTQRRSPGLDQGLYGLNVGIRFRRKITNKYADGSTKTYYDHVSHGDTRLKENGKWLIELIGMNLQGRSYYSSNEDKFPEIEYTEKTASFFRGFITGIFKINELIKQLNDPQTLETAIQQNKALEAFNK